MSENKELRQYHAIGTLEECREATGKQKKMQMTEGCDNGRIRKCCGRCGCFVLPASKYCSKCGQRLNWNKKIESPEAEIFAEYKSQLAERTIVECAYDIKNILNNAERAEEYTGETLVEINELVDEILSINAAERR